MPGMAGWNSWSQFLHQRKIAIASNWRSGTFLLIKQVFSSQSILFTAVQKLQEPWSRLLWRVLARSVKSDIDTCYEALKDAKYPASSHLYRNQSFTGSLNSTKPRKKFLKLSKACRARSKFELWSSRRKTDGIGFPLASRSNCSRCRG